MNKENSAGKTAKNFMMNCVSYKLTSVKKHPNSFCYHIQTISEQDKYNKRVKKGATCVVFFGDDMTMINLCGCQLNNLYPVEIY